MSATWPARQASPRPRPGSLQATRSCRRSHRGNAPSAIPAPPRPPPRRPGSHQVRPSGNVRVRRALAAVHAPVPRPPSARDGRAAPAAPAVGARPALGGQHDRRDPRSPGQVAPLRSRLGARADDEAPEQRVPAAPAASTADRMGATSRRNLPACRGRKADGLDRGPAPTSWSGRSRPTVAFATARQAPAVCLCK